MEKPDYFLRVPFYTEAKMVKTTPRLRRIVKQQHIGPHLLTMHTHK